VPFGDNRAMARLQAKSIGSPDEVRTFPNGRLEIFNLDDVIIGRTLFEPGWHWATDVKPIAGTASCQYHHLGVCVRGRLGIRMDDGTTFEIGPNTVFDIPAGHDGWVIGDDPWETYDVAGMRAFGRAVEIDDRILASIEQLLQQGIESGKINHAKQEKRAAEFQRAHDAGQMPPLQPFVFITDYNPGDFATMLQSGGNQLLDLETLTALRNDESVSAGD
jgi:hypothetical protein